MLLSAPSDGADFHRFDRAGFSFKRPDGDFRRRNGPALANLINPHRLAENLRQLLQVLLN